MFIALSLGTLGFWENVSGPTFNGIGSWSSQAALYPGSYRVYSLRDTSDSVVTPGHASGT